MPTLDQAIKFADNLYARINSEDNVHFRLFQPENQEFVPLTKEQRQYFKVKREEGWPVLKTGLVIFDDSKQILNFSRTPLVGETEKLIETDAISLQDLQASSAITKLRKIFAGAAPQLPPARGKLPKEASLEIEIPDQRWAIINKQNNHKKYLLTLVDGKVNIYGMIQPMDTYGLVSHSSVLIYDREGESDITTLAQKNVKGCTLDAFILEGMAHAAVDVRGYKYFFEIYSARVKAGTELKIAGMSGQFKSVDGAIKAMEEGNKESKDMEIRIVKTLSEK